jgi:hypothetical protein
MLNAFSFEGVAIFNDPLDVRIDMIDRTALRFAGVKLLHARKLLRIGVRADELVQCLLIMHLKMHRVVDSSHDFLTGSGGPIAAPGRELWLRLENSKLNDILQGFLWQLRHDPPLALRPFGHPAMQTGD